VRPADRDRLMAIAAWARGKACHECQDGIAVEHDGCARALEIAAELERIAGQ
jgi:hypothetical protein